MAPAVIRIFCLLATISCLTTAQSTISPSTDGENTSPPALDTNTTSTTRTTVTSDSNNVSRSTQPEVTNGTTTTTPQTLVYGSCANPDLCCSGLNNSCHRLNCFCDVACLRLRDCCPDFKPTCVTVKNGTNGTEQNTLPLTGSCSDPTLCCSGTNHNCFRGCFCDETCKELNDCCPDLNSTCIFNTTTAAPPETVAPPKDVLTVLTYLKLEVLSKGSYTEEKRQAALQQVFSDLMESLVTASDTGIYSFKVARIEPLSLGV